jgi:hypothetical protein
LLKTFGYLSSTASVVLLGAVSWESAHERPLLAACLIAGMASSVTGMFLRWLSHQRQKSKLHEVERRAAAAEPPAATSPRPRGLTNDVRKDATRWEPQHEPW